MIRGPGQALVHQIANMENEQRKCYFSNNPSLQSDICSLSLYKVFHFHHSLDGYLASPKSTGRIPQESCLDLLQLQVIITEREDVCSGWISVLVSVWKENVFLETYTCTGDCFLLQDLLTVYNFLMIFMIPSLWTFPWMLPSNCQRLTMSLFYSTARISQTCCAEYDRQIIIPLCKSLTNSCIESILPHSLRSHIRALVRL